MTEAESWEMREREVALIAFFSAMMQVHHQDGHTVILFFVYFFIFFIFFALESDYCI